MTINFSKCKVSTSSEKPIVLEGRELKAVGEFCFLGSIVPSTENMAIFDLMTTTFMLSSELNFYWMASNIILSTCQ